MATPCRTCRTIPVLFVNGEQNPECAWVFEGQGEATPQWDGAPHLVMGGVLHALSPRGNWRPVGVQDRDACEAWVRIKRNGIPEDGGYELCGPGIAGNPHGFPDPALARHQGVVIADLPPLTPQALRDYLGQLQFKGLVWHHPDGRKAKIGKADLGLRWP